MRSVACGEDIRICIITVTERIFNLNMHTFVDRAPLLSTPTGTLVIQPIDSSERLKLSLVVPTYNEGQNIAELVRALHAAFAKKFFGPYEIIVVDDNSPD